MRHRDWMRMDVERSAVRLDRVRRPLKTAWMVHAAWRHRKNLIRGRRKQKNHLILAHIQNIGTGMITDNRYMVSSVGL